MEAHGVQGSKRGAGNCQADRRLGETPPHPTSSLGLQRGEAAPQGTFRLRGWTSQRDENRLKTSVLPQYSELCQNPRTSPQLRLVERGISHPRQIRAGSRLNFIKKNKHGISYILCCYSNPFPLISREYVDDDLSQERLSGALRASKGELLASMTGNPK